MGPLGLYFLIPAVRRVTYDCIFTHHLRPVLPIMCVRLTRPYLWRYEVEWVSSAVHDSNQKCIRATECASGSKKKKKNSSIAEHITNSFLRSSPCHNASPHCPSRWWMVMHWPYNWSTMALIAAGCLVSLSPGAKGNNGLMGKILQAVTSFGFRMCFTGLREGVCIVCVCLCVCLTDCVLPADMLKRDELSEFEAIHQTINYPLRPLSGDGGASHGHLCPGNIFSPEPPLSLALLT